MRETRRAGSEFGTQLFEMTFNYQSRELDLLALLFRRKFPPCVLCPALGGPLRGTAGILWIHVEFLSKWLLRLDETQAGFAKGEINGAQPAETPSDGRFRVSLTSQPGLSTAVRASERWTLCQASPGRPEWITFRSGTVFCRWTRLLENSLGWFWSPSAIPARQIPAETRSYKIVYRGFGARPKTAVTH